MSGYNYCVQHMAIMLQAQRTSKTCLVPCIQHLSEVLQYSNINYW